MMLSRILENVSLKQFNTFKIDARASFFSRAASVDDLKDLLENSRSLFPFLVIGGGSNILFTGNYKGLVIQPAINELSIVQNEGQYCLVKAGAGVGWDQFVRWSVENGLGGIENLSLIPGSTGSAPIQNIGAYGAEIKDVTEKVNYLDIETLEENALDNKGCEFGYRTSIFKNQLKNRAIITSVVFRLSRDHRFNTSYGNLHQEAARLGHLSLQTIREAVINIRRSKLPDPEILGNAGSFFKNPVVDRSKAMELKDRYEELSLYPLSEMWVKIPAGWLIEKCGWKGKRVGDCGVHEKQALVLVNYGNSTGKDIVDLAMKIRDSVFSGFGITLEPEVNII